MLKKFILLLCLVAPVALVAQDKIAFINSQEIFMKMPELKDVESKMAAKREELNKSIQALETQYQADVEAFNEKLKKFNEDSTSVSESDLMDAQKALSQLQERIQTRGENAQAEFQNFQQTLLTPLQEKMSKAVKDVGTEQNYQYIFDAAALLYTGNSAIDASKLVKTKLGIVD